MKQILYNIYTEDSPLYRENIRGLLVNFPSYTFIFPAEGVWQGAPEHSLIVQIIADASAHEAVRTAAKMIRGYNKQEAVLITTTPIESEML